MIRGGTARGLGRNGLVRINSDSTARKGMGKKQARMAGRGKIHPGEGTSPRIVNAAMCVILRRFIRIDGFRMQFDQSFLPYARRSQCFAAEVSSEIRGTGKSRPVAVDLRAQAR